MAFLIAADEVKQALIDYLYIAQAAAQVGAQAAEIEAKKQAFDAGLDTLDDGLTRVDAAVDLLESGYAFAGDYNPSTNVPALTADATLGQTDPDHPRRYNIPAPGPAQFAGDNFIVGDIIGPGDLRQYPNGKWNFSEGVTYANSSLKYQFGDMVYVEGAPDLSVYTSNNTTATETRVWGAARAGLLARITGFATRQGVLKMKVMRRKSNGRFQVLQQFYLPCLLGNNIFVAGVDFPLIELTSVDHIAWFISPTTAYIGYKQPVAITHYQIDGDATGSDIPINTTTTTTGFGLRFEVAEGITKKTIEGLRYDVSILEAKTADAEAILYEDFKQSPDVVFGVAPDSTYSSTPVDNVTRVFFQPLKPGYLKELSFWATRAGVIKFEVFRRNPDNTFAVLLTTSKAAVLGLNTVDLSPETLGVTENDYLAWYVGNGAGQIGFKDTTATPYYFVLGDATGESIVPNLTQTFSFGINVTVATGKLKSDITALSSRMAATESAIATSDYELVQSTEVIGQADVSTFLNTNTTASETRILGFEGAGLLDEIEIRSTRVGAIEMKVMQKKIDGKFKHLSSFHLLVTTVGVNVFKSNFHFPDIQLGPDDHIAWYATPTTSYIGYKLQPANHYQFTGNATGDNIVVVATSTVEFGINYTVKQGVTKLRVDAFGNTISDTQSMALSTDAIQQAYLGVKDDAVFGQTSSLSTFTSPPADSVTRLMNDMLSAGYSKQVQFWATRAGAIRFILMKRNPDGTFSVLSFFDVSALIGLNTITYDNFGVSFVPDGCYLAWYSHTTTGGLIGFKAGSAIYHFITGDVTEEGAADRFSTQVTSTFIFAINITVSAGLVLNDLAELKEKAEASASDLSSVRKSLTPIGNIKTSKLLTTTLPSDWVAVGDWTATANGLKSPVSGGWGTYAYCDKKVSIDEDDTTFHITATVSASVFCIGRFSSIGIGTTLAGFDLAAGKLRIYQSVNTIGGVPASVLSETDIGFTIVAGREYVVGLKKDRETYHALIVDTVTQQQKRLSFNNTGATLGAGAGVDYMGVVFNSGEILIRDMVYSSCLPRSPYIFIAGDSNTHADTIRLLSGGGHLNRWVGKLATHVKRNIFIMARGGDDSELSETKLTMLLPKLDLVGIAIYAIGTNDDTFSVWLQNFIDFRAAMEAKGTEVIPTTIPPRPGREAFAAAVNEYIVGWGGRYVDFARATTTGGLRVTRNAAYFESDNIHYNVAGHAVCFNQVLIDVPELVTL